MNTNSESKRNSNPSVPPRCQQQPGGTLCNFLVVNMVVAVVVNIKNPFNQAVWGINKMMMIFYLMMISVPP